MPHDDPLPPLDWADEDVPVGHPAGEAIDLRRSAGVRLWVRQSPGALRLVMQFHHACCDGLAAIQVAEELLIAYHHEMEGSPAADWLRPLDPARLPCA